jgi:predicted secreted Zn-dependent protease
MKNSQKQKGSVLLITIFVAFLILVAGSYLLYQGNVAQVKILTASNNVSVRGDISSINDRSNKDSVTSSTKTASLVASTSVSVAPKKTKWVERNIPYNVVPCPTPAVVNRDATPLDISYKTGLVVLSDYLYYPLDGHLQGQLGYQLTNCSPALESSGTFAAGIANTMINWDIQPTGRGGLICDMHDAVVGLHITILMPQWTPSPDSPSDLQGIWNTYNKNLMTHEDGHAVLAKQYAGQIYSYLVDLQNTHACVSRSDIDSHVGVILDGLNAAQAKYDAETKHGETQGVMYFLN